MAEDILQAQNEYSRYALTSLLAEGETQLENFERLLYEFAGSEEIISKEQLLQYMIKAGIDESRISLAIDLLCDTTFLGIEVERNRFEFINDETHKLKMQSLARRVSDAQGGTERFRVNLPFHAYLEIKPVDLQEGQ